MVDYVRLAATANRLIRANGVPVMLTKPLTDDYDPVTSSADERTPASYDGFAVRDPDSDYQQTFADGTRQHVEFAPLWVVMPDAAPLPGDSLHMTDKDWVVVSCTPLAPGPLTLLYKVLVKSP